MRGHIANRDYEWVIPTVYFFEAVGSELLKIGFSIDPVKRFRQIQTSSPFPLRAVLVRSGDKVIERQIHESLDYCRQHGEWFSATEEELDELTELRSRWWDEWHSFVRNITDVRPCPRREIDHDEFLALCRYETEFNNPLDRSLL